MELTVIVADALRSGITGRAMQFLKRVSRCFLFGWDIECAVMCRAALEAVLADTIPDAEMRGRGLKPETDNWGHELTDKCGRPIWTLNKRIKAATTDWKNYTAWLSGEAAEHAKKIQKAGNDVIHSSATIRPAEIEPQAQDCVHRLVTVLNALAHR